MAWKPCGDPQRDDAADAERPGCGLPAAPPQRAAVEYVVNALRDFAGFDNVIDDVEDDGRLEEFLTELSEACPRLRLGEV